MGIIRLSQECETELTAGQTGHFSYRYAYARAVESREVGERGQDYLCLVTEGDSLVFALCDGVSQSFYGDLAASFLGDALLDWLAKAGAAAGDFQAELSDYLQFLVPAATAAVQAQQLPAGLPDYLAVVLEEVRSRGSEAMLVCGRIDCPASDCPDGRVLLAWMGDGRLRVWGPQGECTTQVGHQLDSARRWSTVVGARGGAPQVFVSPLEALTRIVVYSDGLATYDAIAEPPDDEALRALLARSAEDPAGDDISFLEVTVELGAPAQPQPLPPPDQLESVLSGDRAWLSWAPTPGASGYEVEVTGALAWTGAVEGTVWKSAALAPGWCGARVRSLQDGVPGPWSEEIRFGMDRTQARRAKPGFWRSVLDHLRWRTSNNS